MKKRVVLITLLLALTMAFSSAAPLFTASAADNVLKGKKILFVGDSICEAHVEQVDDTKKATAGWAGRIGVKNEMDWLNKGKSGASVSTVRGSNTVIAQLKAVLGSSYDFIILHGGVNDAWDQAPVGKMSAGIDPSTFDKTTFAGGLEELFAYARTNFPEAKLGYIINFRLPIAKIDSLHDMTAYFNVAKDICDKWDIEYLDLYNNEKLNSDLEVATSKKCLYDNIHPNTAGYDILAPVIEEFIKTLASGGSANKAPTVIPAVTSWEGSTGKFYPASDMSVVLASSSLLSDAQKNIVKEYFKDILGVDITIKTGTAAKGDICITSSSDKSLGDEGYTLIADDKITISGNTAKSRLYGIITFLQSCEADGFFPKGSVRDVPQYKIRSGMIDVGRAFIPMDYLTEITKYYAWFKLNEIHIHINDNVSGGKGYFRLESDVEGLTAADHYTKAEYRAYQKEVLEYGVEVVTEIDTPAHSICFYCAGAKKYMLDSSHLDITKPETLKFVEDLWDEYISGDDPVFISKTVHIGTDEYRDGYGDYMRAYTDALIKFINSRGYTPRFWSSFGRKSLEGTTPVSNKAQANYWALEADPKYLVDNGYDIINSTGPMLYVVPGTPETYFYDYFDLNHLYKNWFINYLGRDSKTAIDPNYEHLLGASFAVWNEEWYKNTGFSRFDVFDRIRSAVCLVSEKTWTGEKTALISSSDFLSRFDKLSKKIGGANPYRYAELPITDKDITVSSVGFPYVFDADIEIKTLKSDILSGADGRLFVDEGGNISFNKEFYTFRFDTKLKAGKYNIKLYCDNKKTLLIVDDTWFFDPVNTSSHTKEDSSTFVLPLEKVGSNGVAVNSFTVKEPDFIPDDYKQNRNLALNKKVTVSGLEVYDGRLNEPLAVDGDIKTRLSFANQVDEQWMIVDLGGTYNVSKVVIKFFEHITDYKVLVSEDGENFKEVHSVTNGGNEGVRNITDNIVFPTVKVRYVKYIQLKRWYSQDYHRYYSGGISEFEVYAASGDHADLVSEAEKLKDKYENVAEALAAVKAYEIGKNIYIPHLEGLYNLLAEAVKNPIPKPADYLLGDVDGNGKIEAKDYMLLKRYCLKTVTLDADQLKRSDINGDTKADAKDYNLLKRHCLKTYTIQQ